VTDLHRDGVGKHLIGKLADARGHGRGEHERLPFYGQLFDDAPDVGEETHVEHSVRLIDDEDLEALEVDRLLRKVIEETAGTGHDNIDAGTELADLRVNTHSAVDGAALQMGVAPQFPDGHVYLFRQLPCGRDDEGAHPSPRAGEEVLENGQHEGCRLARPGLSKAHDVFAGEDRRDGLHLDGSGDLIAERLHGGGDLRMKLE